MRKSSAISRSVQFEGIDAVVRAYQNRDVPAWSIFCNNQFMFKYEGKAIAEGVKMLDSVLNDLADVNSPAVYTLKIYEDLPGGKLKNNTPDDGSFNFRLQAPAAGQEIGRIGYGNKILMDEIKALHLRLDQLAGQNDSDEDDSIGKIERVMEIPGVKELVQGVIGQLFGTTPPRAIAGIPQDGQTAHVTADGAEQLYLSERLISSLHTLSRHDPELEQHLCALAAMAEQTPQKFKMIVGMLAMV